MDTEFIMVEEFEATNSLKAELDEFLGSRSLPDSLKYFLESRKTSLHMPLYRGMMFPIHQLKIGEKLEEWYSSSHWSKDYNIAYNFASDGYIPEGLIEELEENSELLKEFEVDDAVELFVPVIFKLEKNTQAIDCHKLVSEWELSKWEREKEVTFLGMDFLMTKITPVKPVQEGKEYYYLMEVQEIL